MTTPTNATGRTGRPRWLLIAAVGCAAVVALIAVVVFVVGGGDDAGAENRAAATGNEQVEGNHDNITLPTIPYTEVEAWTSKRVEMEGELPEGTIYRGADSNPSWVKVNRFTGQMHYEPKAKGIQLRPYDITIVAELPDGGTANIEATVEVIAYVREDPIETVEPPILPRTIVRAGDSVKVPLEGPQLPEGTTYIDNVGPVWMRVDHDTGEVHFILDETFVGYPEGVRDIMLTAWTPDGQAVNIYSEVEVVAGP